MVYLYSTIKMMHGPINLRLITIYFKILKNDINVRTINFRFLHTVLKFNA